MDTLCTTEAWFKSDIDNKCCEITRYNLTHNDPPRNIRGGDSAMYKTYVLRSRAVLTSNYCGMVDYLEVGIPVAIRNIW